MRSEDRQKEVLCAGLDHCLSNNFGEIATKPLTYGMGVPKPEFCAFLGI